MQNSLDNGLNYQSLSEEIDTTRINGIHTFDIVIEKSLQVLNVVIDGRVGTRGGIVFWQLPFFGVDGVGGEEVVVHVAVFGFAIARVQRLNIALVDGKREFSCCDRETLLGFGK